jgi:hypothetical protein
MQTPVRGLFLLLRSTLSIAPHHSFYCTAAQMNAPFSLCNTDVISLSVDWHADSCQRTSRQFVQPRYRFLSLLSLSILGCRLQILGRPWLRLGLTSNLEPRPLIDPFSLACKHFTLGLESLAFWAHRTRYFGYASEIPGPRPRPRIPKLTGRSSTYCT